jgi:hypothetical protein
LYFTPSPDIADNIEELSEIHSFYEQVHSMNENTGNLGDITDEVEMAEKFHNQIPPPPPPFQIIKIDIINVFQIYSSCHPIHHDSNYVIIVYCIRSSDRNNHFGHHYFAKNDGLCQIQDPARIRRCVCRGSYWKSIPPCP